ncbi:MAG: sigma-54-dependent Fis family transcriptional regulator, partial [Bacillota bacterium]
MHFTNFNSDRASRDIFLREGILPAEIHPTLAGSWIRCRDNGVDPLIESAPPAKTLIETDVDKILLEVARPYFAYFGKLLVVSQCALALSNSRGVIIHVEGYNNREIKRLMEKHNFLVGADWSEKVVGTGAIGTAIEEKTNVLVQGVEHYSSGWHPYSCAASPMFDHTGGEIIGVVNASTYHGHLHLHSLGWVAAVARLIESDFKRRYADIKYCRQSPTGKTSRHFFPDNPLQPEQLNILGRSRDFLFALNTARRVAGTGLNVLLTGETGTGKEVFARAIHRDSNRSAGPFTAVNCGALPGELVYSELFGYTEGAFTGASRKGHPGRFEQAHGGTIFLDEVGDAPCEVQVGLLRVLEEKMVYRLGSTKPVPVDVRVVAATSRDIPALVREGRFREDLYYRLAGINIKIPSLRERREDIPILASYFLEKTAGITGPLNIDGEAMEALLEYKWPGNVRELKNLMERLAALADGPAVTRETLLQWGPNDIGSQTANRHSETDYLMKAIRES